MNRGLVLILILIGAGLAHAQDIAGDWQGTLSAGGAELRLVLHITKATNGALKATLDGIDQPGSNGIPVNSATLKDSKLSLDVQPRFMAPMKAKSLRMERAFPAHRHRERFCRSSSSAPPRQ